jgi:lysine 2,3-aminomutase
VSGVAPGLFLEIVRGQGVLWAADPKAPARPRAPVDWRRAALLRAFRLQGPLTPERLASVTDVTVMDTERLDGPDLVRLIRELRRHEPPPLIRAEADWSAPDWDAAPLVQAAEQAGEPPFFVHGVIQSLRDPSPAAAQGIEALADRGVPLSAEVWLLRGATDEVEGLRELMRRLLGLRVRPYYLVDGEWLPPDRRLAPERALELVRALRGWISGTGVPQFVRESPAGRRTPIIPDYVEEIAEGEVKLRDYRGVSRTYRNPPG